MTPTTTRTVAEIEADIERARAEVKAHENTEAQLKQSAEALRAALDQRIQETFAEELEVISETRRKAKEAATAGKPASQRLYALWDERKWALMVPGTKVLWAEPRGWRGAGSVTATVIQRAAKKVQIDLGGIRRDRLKWVSLKSLSAVRPAAETS